MTADSQSNAEDLYLQSEPLPSVLSTDDFRAVLHKTVAALNALLTGDPQPFNGLWSHADDVSLQAPEWRRVEEGLQQLAETPLYVLRRRYKTAEIRDASSWALVASSADGSASNKTPGWRPLALQMGS